MEYSLTGSVQTRVHQFFATLTALKIELRTGMSFRAGSPSATLNAARRHGYVPEWFTTRGAIDKRRQAAVEHMEYVATLLKGGGFATMYGEEIVVGNLVYVATEDCGCRAFAPMRDKTNRVGLLPMETATMHVCDING